MKALKVFLSAVLVAVLSLLAVMVLKYGYHVNYGPEPAHVAVEQDRQVQKNLWYICTPDGWREIETSVPVHINGIPDAPGIHSLTTGPYILGPFSPAQTFTGKWGKYPAQYCGPERKS